ncbi:MAG TPA: alpha/beta hydrolase [Terriglobales bacterium]|nr:alpha/beta hydrolase [Terriglobales bacterium]
MTPRLFLLHGLLGSSAQWRACAGELGEQFPLTALDLPGISREPAIAPADFAGLARWLAERIETTPATGGEETFAIIASSWAGAVALRFAADAAIRARLRQHLRAMVLIAPVHPFWVPNRRQRWLLRPPVTRLIAPLGRHLPRGAYRALLEPSFGDPGRVTDDAINVYRSALQLKSTGRGIAAYARQYQADLADLGMRLPGIETPTLLLWGERDRVVPAASAMALAGALPRAELRLLRGLGHLPFQEDPAACNRAMLPFLLSH